MGQDHHVHKHDHSHSTLAGRGLALAFALNLSFAIIEVIGGLYTNSISILSDSLHDFGDATALGLAWYLEKLSRSKADSSHSYGYRRYSLLSAWITSSILCCGSIVIAWHAVGRILSPEPVKVYGMMGLAVMGILVNGLAFRFTHQGHSHNEKAVSLHLLEDVLGWVAVLIASIVMTFADVPWLDPALSLCISIYMIWGALKRIRDTSMVFLQKVPHGVDLDKMRTDLTQVNGVLSVEDLHVWSTDGQQLIVTLSVKRRKEITDSAALRKDLRAVLGDLCKHHVTIEILDSDEASLGCGDQ